MKAEGIYRYLKHVSRFNNIILGFALFLYFFLAIFTMAWNISLIFWPDVLMTCMLWGVLLLAFIFVTTRDASQWSKHTYYFFANCALAVMIYIMALWRDFSFFGVFPVLYIALMFLFLFLCIFGIIAFVNTAVILPAFLLNCKKNKIKAKSFSKRKNGKLGTISLLVLIIMGVPFGILQFPECWNIPITIKPGDYQVEFAFWGHWRVDAVSTTALESMNNHSVTLVQCNFANIPAQQADYVSNLTVWNNTYPNITIFNAIPGIPGGAVWDGSTNGTIEFTKDYITLIRSNNLTNVKGLAFDLEGPILSSLPEGYDYSPNASRHDEGLELWNEFFEWKETNEPNLTLSAINYVESVIDTFDGDYDLHYLRRYPFLNLDGFDEYAPMLYRCWYWVSGPQPYGSVPEMTPLAQYLDGGHYLTYYNLDLLSKSLESKFGNTDKMGVYLGITNCTCYGADVNQYQHGQPAGKGYDALVRDALIAKHFGVPKITIFLYNTALENGYSMGGVFDSYGDDFLDRFNESVNGPNATDEFTIWYKPQWNFVLGYGPSVFFIYDQLSSLNSFLGIALALLSILANTLLLAHEKVIKEIKKLGNRIKRRS
ncbi:MAG: hypothetical protein ACFFCS_01030 [Candidatus Hodarchaeota archaeon]